MFERLTQELMELTVEERGRPAGLALPAFPLCCSIVICSSSSSSEEKVD